MNTLYPGLTYQHSNGQVTTYDLQEVQHGNGPHIYVASESPTNQGPGFESPFTRDAVARDASARIQAKDQVEPSQVQLYQQKPDGDFDKVDFRSLGRDSGFQATDGSPAPTRDAGKSQDWSESHRETQSREDVQKELQSDLFAPRETPQQLAQRQNQEYRDLSSPEFNRVSVSAEERQRFQDQVDRSREQNTQNQNQTQQDQEAHKHTHTPRY